MLRSFSFSSEASPASGARQNKIHPRPPNSGPLGSEFNWRWPAQSLGPGFRGRLGLAPNRHFLRRLRLEFSRGWLVLLWPQLYFVAKLLQPLDEVLGGLLFIQVVEVITTQFLVINFLLQNVPGRLQDRPRHRDHCPFLAAARRQPMIERSQIAAFLELRGPRRFGSGALEPLVALRRFAAPILAARLILARASGPPTHQLIIGRERTHLGANLGQQGFGAPLTDAADRIQALKLRLVGQHLLFDPLAVNHDLLLQALH